MTDYTDIVDDLGAARAVAAEANAEVKRLETMLRKQGAGTYEGLLYRATVTASTRAVTAWKAIAEKLGASRQIIRANTRQTEVVSVRVTAREKVAA